MFLVLPFETLWSFARGGHVQRGDRAPDFDLETLDKSARVRLDSFRGREPVVLIFGSYT
jgi:peroxiredoxin